jgi:hypothetical protein
MPQIVRRVAALLLPLLLVPVAAHAAPFSDMERSWYGYQENVSYLVGKGSINGYPDGLFHPQETVNRAEFLKLVFRSRGTTEPVSGDCFADVHQSDWFAPFVCAAKRRNIVSGYTVGSRILFKPAQPIVFAEAIKMVVLAYGAEVQAATGEQWYAPYVQELDRQGILPASSYIPWEPITRERAADLIARFVRHEEDRAILNRSPGCSKAPVDASQSLMIDGVERTYLLTPR